MEKIQDNQYKRLERVVYISLWIIVAMIPLVEQVYEYLTGADASVEFDKVISVWLFVLPFFVLFWLHDLFLMRLFMRRGKKYKMLYAVLTVLMIVGIVSEISLTHKWRRHERRTENKELVTENPAIKVVVDTTQTESVAMTVKEPNKTHYRGGRPRGPINMFLVTNTVFALFVVSINIAIKLYFRSMSNRRRIARLEAENTSTRLQFLKYQINPHFFMNTLNNIHALIDIDSERAQNVVVELSKMMRYVLYEIDKDNVTLQQEVEFLNNYIELMRIRLTDNVKIEVEMPKEVADIKLPPLLFIPFVENIFKHGISYREESKVKISLTVSEGNIRFYSRNTNYAHRREDKHHGIGLENLRRRLDLLYGNNYKLKISNDASTFEVELTLPAESEKGGKS